MEVSVTLRTSIEFNEIDDINDAQDIIYGEMTPEEIIELANSQGNVVNIEVDV